MRYIQRLVWTMAFLSCLGIFWYACAELDLTQVNEQRQKIEEKRFHQEDISQQKEKTESIQDMLQTATDQDEAFWYVLLLIFLAGVITSFTPCVYPMIPITVGILQAQGSRTLGSNILSAITYVLGIAVVYSGLGYVAATSAVLFGQWISNPWVIGFVILFFLYLAFSLFGFYEMYVPAFMNHRSNLNVGGSLFKVFIFGMLSGTIASPCLTPALAVILGFVAKMANPVLGLLSLFVFSLGMGAQLIIIGMFSGALTMLPRAGEWMVEVKRIMGFAMIAMAVYFAQPLLGQWLGVSGGYGCALLLYSMVIFVAAAYFLLTSRTYKIKLLIGLLLGLAGISLIIMNLEKISLLFS